MDHDFRRQIAKELKGLTRAQIRTFSWRSTVYALPFLGHRGDFSFWKKEDTQKHLYAVLYVIDLGAADTTAYTTAYTAAVTAAYAAAAAVAYTAAAAAAAADAAAVAAAAAAAYTDAYAAAAAVAVAATAADAAAQKNKIDLRPILLEELAIIKGKKRTDFSIDFYGEIWNDFQKALAAVDCAYWGRLYRAIFDNQFEIDEVALKRRINVPKEIMDLGAAAVGKHLEKLETVGAARLNQARIIILGEKGAGKTCLAKRLVNPDALMTTDEESTAGVDTSVWTLEKEKINVHIWDFAGHTVTHAVHQFFLSERCLYLIVYDGRSELKNRLEYWLDHMQNYGGDSEAIILVNERDKHKINIPINTLQERYAIKAVHYFSIKKDRTKLIKFRTAIAEYIQGKPSWKAQEIPKNDYKVKAALEQLFIKNKAAKRKEFITKAAFEKIAKENGIEDTDALLTNLHVLGISLWYQNMEEFDTMVLNPEWISNGIYTIINWLNNNEKYELSLADFKAIFEKEEERYPSSKYKFFYNLLLRYELAYKLNGATKLVIPHLLQEDRPAQLPDFPIGDSLMLRYHASHPLPPHTISRFIVRHSKAIKKSGKKSIVWRYGVVLENGQGTIALVREEDRIISVAVKGKEKTSFIAALRTTLNEIFNTYQSEKPALEYRIERFGKIPPTLKEQDLWLTEQKILNHHQQGRLYYDDVTDRDMSMTPVVKIYNMSNNITNNITNNNTIITGDQNTVVQNSHFDFGAVNIDLQGGLNGLAQLLSEQPQAEAKAAAKDLTALADAFGLVEDCKTPKEVKRKGVMKRLKLYLEELADEKSTLHKTIKGAKNGISIAQDIGKTYNKIAQWMGLPQIPTPFL